MQSRRMRPLVVTASVLLTLVVAAPAAAQAPPFREPSDDDPYIDTAWVEFSDVKADRQLTHVSATVLCPVDDFRPDAGPQAPCRARVGVTWFLEGKTAKGPKYGLAQPREMLIPRGQTAPYEVTIPPAELRDVLARHRGTSIVGIGSVDPDTRYLGSNLSLASPNFALKRTKWTACGANRFLRLQGGTLLEQQHDDGEREDPGFGPLYSPDIAILTRYKVVGGPARFSLNGVRHQIAAGSEFFIDCISVNAVHRGTTFPAVWLVKGSARVSGRPTARRQFAAIVHTLEGFMGTRSREALDMTVTRDAKKRVSTMRMHKGRTGAITPFLQIRGSSPCTAGNALSVNWRGTIRRA